MNLDPKSIQAGYDRWACVYDTDANPMPALEEPIVRSAIGNPRGCSALDLGCGTGRHAIWLSQAGAQVTAVDFSAGMLEKARSKPGADQIQFVESDLNGSLPWKQEFDLIVSGLVLEHLTNIAAFFRQMKQMLKPGGQAVVSTMHPAMFLKGSKARFTDPESGDVIEPGSIEHSISDCVMAILHAGLRIEKISEHAPDEDFAKSFPRAEKYIGWPMLAVFTMTNIDS